MRGNYTDSLHYDITIDPDLYLAVQHISKLELKFKTRSWSEWSDAWCEILQLASKELNVLQD